MISLTSGLSVYLSVYISFYQYIYLPICISICLPASQSANSTSCLCVYHTQQLMDVGSLVSHVSTLLPVYLYLSICLSKRTYSSRRMCVL